MPLRDQAARGLRDLPIGLHRAVPPSVRREVRHRLGRYYSWEVGFDFAATPPLGPDEVDGPPDFVGIGAQKAGTTWWFQLIIGHPQATNLLTTATGHDLFGPIQKERHFFGRFGTESFGDEHVAQYHRWFPRRRGTITGEWTPDYLAYPWVPPLVARAAPEAKLLLILRDPVTRFRSGYASAIRHGSAHVGETVAQAMEHSMYAANVARWLDHFPAGQLLVLQYERCVADPAQQLKETYRFLGLDPDYRPADLERPINATREGKTRIDDDVTRRLREVFAPDVAALARLVPSLDLSLWEEVGAT
jgi:hypothetical protein